MEECYFWTSLKTLKFQYKRTSCYIFSRIYIRQFCLAVNLEFIPWNQHRINHFHKYWIITDYSISIKWQLFPASFFAIRSLIKKLHLGTKIFVTISHSITQFPLNSLTHRPTCIQETVPACVWTYHTHVHWRTPAVFHLYARKKMKVIFILITSGVVSTKVTSLRWYRVEKINFLKVCVIDVKRKSVNNDVLQVL